MQFPQKPMLMLALGAWLLSGCNNPEASVAPTLDNEAITTAMLQLTNKSNPADVVTATIDNLTATPDFSKDTLRLKAGAAYSALILLADKSKTPATDVTAEIRSRQNIHLFVYTPAAGLGLTVTITDRDTNPAPGPYPVGLASDMTAGAASRGKLNVVLRHQPNTKNGTAAPGSTDLDTSFDVVIN